MAYSYYRAITIDHTKCGSADSSNFPVLISGTYTYLKTVGNGGKVQSSSGYDIQFYSDSALTTALKFERVIWDASTGTVEFWVKVPTLSASSDTVIYMAYGNSAVTTDQQDAANTWSASYVGVYHFGDGSTLSVADSLNSINGTNHSTTATTGKVGGGVALSGSSQYVDLGDPAGVDFGAGNYAFRMWLKPTTGTLVNNTRMMVLGKDTVLGSRQFTVEINDAKGAGTVGAIGTYAFAGGGGTYYGAHTDTNALTENVWQLVRIQRNGNTWECYINGSSVTFTAQGSSLPQTMDATATSLNIGRRNSGGTYDDYFNGSMDDLFIESTARSSSWATTEYNNQNSPSTFYTIGSEVGGSVSDTITVSAAHVYARPQTVNMPASYAVPVTAAHVYARGQTVGVNLSSPLAISAAHVYARGQTVNMPAAYTVPITAAHVYARGQTVNMPGAASIAVTAASVYARGQTVNISAAYTVPITAAHVYVRGQTVNVTNTTGTTIVVDGATVYARGQSVGFTASVKTIVDAAHVYARPQTVGMSAARTIVVDGASYIVRGQSVGVACRRVISVTNGTVIVRGQDVLITDTVTNIVLVAPLYVEIASASYSVTCEQTERAVSCDNSQYICT